MSFRNVNKSIQRPDSYREHGSTIQQSTTMKHFTYILLFIILLSACAAGGENKMMHAEPASKDTAVVHRYEPRLTPVRTEQKSEKADTSETKEIQEETQVTTEDFNEITRQKTEQFLDMSAVVNNRQNPEDLQAYIDKHARKLWANPAKSKAVFQNSRIKNIDSFRIVHFELLNFEEAGGQESTGNYKLKIKAYHNGKSQIIPADLKMYFRINDLNVDGTVYKTITAKILEMKI